MLARGASMTQILFDVVGFDLDGTLLDTSEDLAAAVNHALASAGRDPLPVDRIRPMIGGGARHMLSQGMEATGGCSDEELDVLHQRLLDYYEAHICVHTRPYQHALEALDVLADHGVKLGVMTNKIERYATTLLDTLGMTDRFASIIGGDTLGLGGAKPEAKPILTLVAQCGGGRGVYVGDTIYDVQAGHAAGIPVIACSFGFRSGPVGGLGADAVIDDYRELVGAIERLG